MTEPDVLNPVDVERAIRHVSDRIARSVKVVTEQYKAYQVAEHTWKKAFARAYLHACDSGPAHRAKYEAELATDKERAALIDADTAYRYADGLAEALSEELRALQSLNKSVVAMYSSAGVGYR